MDELSVTVRALGAHTVVALFGEMDVFTAPALRQRFQELVGAGHYNLIVDMSGVGFLDSTGLGVLVGVRKRVRAHDGSVQIACSHERILMIFRITGLDTVFPIHPTPEQALALPA